MRGISGQINDPAIVGQSRRITPAADWGGNKPALAHGSDFESYLADFSLQWVRSSQQRDHLVANSPALVRPLLEAQRTVTRMDLQIQLLSRFADAVGSGARRVQQLGGS